MNKPCNTKLNIFEQRRVNEHEAHRLRQQGMTMREIAKRMHLCERTILTYLQKPPRPFLHIDNK